MLDQVLKLFDVRPDYDLNVMRPQQSLSSLTSRVLLGLEPVLAKEKLDWVIVQGDTTTAFAGALAGFYARVPVAHVEAGLPTTRVRQLLGTFEGVSAEIAWFHKGRTQQSVWIT